MFQPKTKSELKALVENPKVNLGEIDTRLITDMSELFRESSRKDFSGIETWNVSNVTNMSYMFDGSRKSTLRESYSGIKRFKDFLAESYKN